VSTVSEPLDPTTNQPSEGEPEVASAPAEPLPPPTWREVWQVPVLVVSALALAAGLYVVVSTAPKPDFTGDLATASAQVEAGQYADALLTLNSKVMPLVNSRVLSPEQERRFFLLRARSLAMGQRELGLDRPENNASIIYEYAEAEKRHATLDERDHYYLAMAHVSRGEMDKGIARADRLTDAERARRVEVFQRIIDQCLSPAQRNDTLALELLTRLTSDPMGSEGERLWALARQIRLLVAQGYAGEAIDKGVRAIVRMRQPDPKDLGAAYVELGAAYLAVEDAASSREKLEQASALLGPENEHMARVHLMMGRIEHRAGRLESARDRYAAVVQTFSFSEDLPAAILGLAEVQAQRANIEGGTQDDAIEHFTTLVHMLKTGAAHAEVTRERVGESLQGRFNEQFAQGNYRVALAYATLGEKLFGIDDAPPELVRSLGRAHRKIAEDLLAAAGPSAVSLAELDPATQREARAHLIRSGEYSRQFSQRMVEKDRTEEADALWQAADDFDRAGDLDASVLSFRQFSADFPNDKRNGQARMRLAQAFHARGDIEMASREYRQIIEDRDSSAGPTGVLADAAYVPLARCLLSDADPSNDAEGERYLQTVLGGGAGTSQTSAYRAALLEQGEHAYRMGRYEQAIGSFEEFVQRASSGTPGAGEAGLHEVLYRLAEAYRRSAASIATTLEAALPDEEARRLDMARKERLAKAMELYEQARGRLDEIRVRTALQDLYLRNAHFYLADCAFDLKEYTTAIRLYDAAKDRYNRDPASLVAMVQIVSALIAQGDSEKARTANARAVRFFESLPASAWDDPTLPMTRKDWERWLRSQEMLGALAGVSGKAE